MKRITKILPGWLIASWEYEKNGDEVTVSNVTIFRFRPKPKHKIAMRLVKIIGRQFDKIKLRPIRIQVMPNEHFCADFPEGIEFVV